MKAETVALFVESMSEWRRLRRELVGVGDKEGVPASIKEVETLIYAMGNFL